MLISYGEQWRDEHVAEYYALLAAAGAGMAFFVQAANLMNAVPGPRVVLDRPLRPECDRHRPVGSLEAGLKYLIVGAVGSATLLFGSALVYGITGELSFDKIAAAGHAHDAMLVVGLAMIIAGLAFKSSAAPFHMWTPDAYQGAPTPVDGVHVVRDQGRGAHGHLSHAPDGVPRRSSASGSSRSP